MKKKLKVLALLDAIAPTTLDQDLSAELKTEDWKTEANVLDALRQLGHTVEHLVIFDDLDLLRQKLQSFAPDVIFNLADQFKNNRAFDQNIVSFLEMQGLPFTGCSSTGLTLCKHKGISKKILSYHRIHVPNFVIITRGQRIARPKALKFPILVKPLKEESSLGISQASFVENDEQFNERVQFIHDKFDGDVIAEEYIEGREFYVSVLGNHRLRVFPIRELVFKEVPPDEPKIATYKAGTDITDNANPEGEYQAKFSLQYVTAHALVHGSVRLVAFAPERLLDPDVRAVLAKVEVSADPVLSKGYPGQRAAHVEIELNDGRVFKHFQPTRKGDPEMPLTDDEVNEKFLELAMPVIGDPASRELLTALWALDKRPDAIFDFTARPHARAAG